MKNISDKKELSIVIPKQGALPIIQKREFLSLGSNEVRVKMISMGYCGRDKSTIIGQKSAALGRIGHEGGGVIIEAGAKVNNCKIGQNIIIFPFISKHNIGYDWPDGGKGVFSNFPIVPCEAIKVINKSTITPKEWLSYSLIEPFAGVSRALKKGKVGERDYLIILGAGPIGCEQTILSKYLNSRINIVLIDICEEKLELAKNRGVPADCFFVLDNIEEITKYISAHISPQANTLVIHSNPFKESIKQAFRIAPDKATLLFFSGVYDWEEKDNEDLGISINPKKLHYEEYNENSPYTVIYNNKIVELTGSRGYTRTDFEYAADLIINKKIDPMIIVTKILKFDDSIIDNLIVEGGKKSNIKILMSPYNELINY